MPRSLTTFLNALAPVLQTTPTVLRERQRALVLAGVLESQSGRGRGAGVVASPETVGALLISLLASPSLAKSPVLTKSLSNAVSPSKCSLTGEKTFGASVVRIISDLEFAKRTNEIRVQPGGGTAEIVFDGSRTVVPLRESKGKKATVTRTPETSVFLAKAGHPQGSKILISISITSETLQAITALVAKLETNQ